MELAHQAGIKESGQVRHFTLWLFFVKEHENQHHYLMAAMLQSMQDQ